jgi:general secretion pathway protein H
MTSSRSAPTAAREGPATPPTSSPADRRRDAGFALYELILALAILGLVSGVVFPRVVRPPGPAELRAKAQEIAALLRSDRNVALRQQRQVLSRVDLGDGRVMSGAGAGVVSVPADVRLQLVQSSREAQADGGGIRFLPDGRSSGGAITLRRGDAAYEVSVNWLTAAVLVGAAAPEAAR